MNGQSLYATLAAIAAISVVILYVRPDPTTVGLGLTLIAGLAGYHTVKQNTAAA